MHPTINQPLISLHETMPAYKVKIQLLGIFYKSTLAISVGFAIMATTLAMAFPWVVIFQIFAISFMTGGTIASLLYKEISLKHQYYFYYNQAISKATLVVTCISINIAIGVLLIMMSLYI
jgi:hypothetical protein